MKKLFLIGALVFVLMGIDAQARHWSEGHLQTLVKERAPQSRRVDVSIRESAISVGGRRLVSAPFLPRLIFRSEFHQIEVRYDGTQVGGVPVALYTATFDGVRINRDVIARGKVEVASFKKGRIDADLSEASLSSLVRDVPIKIDNQGAITATINNQSVPVTVSTREDNRLVVEAQGQQLAAVSFASDYLPCVPEVSAKPAAVHLSCEIESVPTFLRK